MTTLFRKLRQSWLASNFAVNEGAPVSAIEEFESRHELKLPTQFREYLLTSNGMKEGYTDDEMNSFLSLELMSAHLQMNRHESKHHIDILFAEYCIYALWFMIRITDSGEDLGVYIPDGTTGKQIAPSFESFMELYLQDPVKIFDLW